MTLASYLLKLLATRILLALAVMVGILQILDLLDVTNEILDRNLGAAGVGYYAMLRLPRLIEQGAPLAVLAGSLFAFAKLAGDSAVTAMRSTGISIYRITLMAVPAAVFLALAQLAIGMVIAPRTDRMLGDWWQASAPKAETKVAAITFRAGDEIVIALPRDPDGRSLQDITIYKRDGGGRLVQRTHAPAAVHEDNGWRLIDPRFESIGTAGITEGAARTMSWSQGLTPGDVRALSQGQTVITAAEARRALDGGLSVRPRTFYDTQLQRGWAAPLACVVMLLLAAPTAMANFRGGGATLLVQCLAAGLLYLVFDGAFTALGENGAAPPILAAWAAPAIFSALGITVLLYQEG